MTTYGESRKIRKKNHSSTVLPFYREYIPRLSSNAWTTDGIKYHAHRLKIFLYEILGASSVTDFTVF